MGLRRSLDPRLLDPRQRLSGRPSVSINEIRLGEAEGREVRGGGVSMPIKA
jgi:hypothetical protein